METKRLIRYRAKGVNPCDGWVKGGMYYTDNNHNDPFNSTPVFRKYFIVSYFSGDWNMGKWEHVEVIPKTIQEFTGEYDSFTEEIYEGDILRCYNVSYDEDGTRSVSLDFTEGVVIFENGAFVLDTSNQKIHFPLKSMDTEIKVVGNVFTLKKNPTANNYRANSLLETFEKYRNNTYPEHIEAAFITFAKESAQIIMDDYLCRYKPNEQTLVIVFSIDSNKFMITKGNLDSTPEYQLYVCNDKRLLQAFVQTIKTTNFQTIIDTLENYKK